VLASAWWLVCPCKVGQCGRTFPDQGKLRVTQVHLVSRMDELDPGRTLWRSETEEGCPPRHGTNNSIIICLNLTLGII